MSTMRSIRGISNKLADSKRLLAICSFPLLSLLFTTSANAIATYSYVGLPFNLRFYPGNDFYGGVSDRGGITGSFVLADSLPASVDFQNISGLVQSYSFDDGRQTLDNSNSSVFGFSVSTDSSGIINLWSVVVASPRPAVPFVYYGGISTSFTPGTILPVVNNADNSSFGYDYYYDASVRVAYDQLRRYADTSLNIPQGTWTVTVVPEPATPLLFVLGLAGIGFVRKVILT